MGRKRKQSTLTDLQRKFVDEYLIDKNATQAYIRTYPGSTSYFGAATAAKKLLKNAQIKAEVSAAQRDASKRTHITADKVLRTFANVAFFDPIELVDIETDQLKRMKHVASGARRSISGMKVKRYMEKGPDGNFIPYEIIEYKFRDSLAAARTLFEHLGLSRDVNQVEMFLMLFPEAVREQLKTMIGAKASEPKKGIE